MSARDPRQGILSLTIRDKSALYASYMPFIKNGGLFIPTAKPYKLGDEVFMLLTLTDSKEKLPVAALGLMNDASKRKELELNISKLGINNSAEAIAGEIFSLARK